MEPRYNLDKLTEDTYNSMVSTALKNTAELMKLVDNDVYAETLIKTYGQLKEIDFANGMESFKDLLAFDIESGMDPDMEDRCNKHTLVEFQTGQARKAIETYLTQKMNASFSGIFTVHDRGNYYDKANSLWNSFEDNKANHIIFEDNLEALIAFVNK